MITIRDTLPCRVKLGGSHAEVRADATDASLVYRTGDAVYGMIIDTPTAAAVETASAESAEETGSRMLLTGVTLDVKEYRFRGGFSRWCDGDTAYLAVVGGGKIKVGDDVRAFCAGQVLDLSALHGVYALEIDETSVLLQIALREDE